jgi:hypothetical protein
MSINNFENAAPIDEEVTSKSGRIVNKYLKSKDSLEQASLDAIIASYDFGYIMGAEDKQAKIIEALNAAGLTGAAEIASKE